MEGARLGGRGVAVSAIVLEKAFDVVDRSTLILLMGHAGLPRLIVVAFASYMEGCRAVNRTGQRYGSPHFRESERERERE
eukprot:5650358-Alexandrium_andersonii.AAC.1